MDKPVGTLLLLWPALWGLLLAKPGLPGWQNLLVFVFGTFLMRSAGCAINDYADCHIDGKVSRTQLRPLVQGLIKPIEALILAGVLAVLAFGLVLLTNRITVYLSFFAVIFAGVYPFTKRWISSPQAVLGLAFAWAIPMGFTAESEQLPLIAWGFLLSAIIWIISYDTYYALADREDDQHLGIGSTALLFGRHAAQMALGLNVGFIVSFYWLCMIRYDQLSGDSSDISVYGWGSIAPSVVLGLVHILALVCAVYQFVVSQSDQPGAAIKAFKLNNLSGLILTIGLIVINL